MRARNSAGYKTWTIHAGRVGRIRELVEFCMLPLFDIAAVRHESSCGFVTSGLIECVEPFVVSL